MSTAKPNTKAIQYAYATSTTATKYGRGKTGCYYIAIFRADGWEETQRIGPFKTWQEAHDEAEKIDLAYSRFSNKNPAA